MPMKKPLRTAPSPRPAPHPDATRLHSALVASLAFTPVRTLERFACFLGVIGATEAPTSGELIRRITCRLGGAL